MWLVANEDVKGVCDSVDIHKGERILMEMSRKFTLEDIRQLAFQSNFCVQVATPPFSGYPVGSASCSQANELQSQCCFWVFRFLFVNLTCGDCSKASMSQHVWLLHSPAQPLYCVT